MLTDAAFFRLVGLLYEKFCCSLFSFLIAGLRIGSSEDVSFYSI